ncbi:MAG: Fic family protein [Planctomycetes bacterium]|nr:Fic family protein [Planctomycetota bacterium]
MQRGETGEFATLILGGEPVRAFVPHPLPPVPPIEFRGALQALLEQALLAVGRLDSIAALLPDPRLFLYTYVRKEAVLSSQIEGTQSSLSDLLLFEMTEAPGVPLDDVVEVSNYVAAMEHGLKRLRNDFPMCNRLIREIHEKLMKRGRGSEKEPGHFRTSQNWIGGTRPGNARFVPPPPQALADCMTALERFLNDDRTGLPVVVKAALAHVQFETIHPFLDGNGRVGRLLITLLLCHAGVLQEPMLYLSLYLKEQREEYYRLLNQVRTEGDWEAWLEFFLTGVRATADSAVATARRLVALFQKDRARIQEQGRAAGSALRVHDVLRERPLASLGEVRRRTGLSFPASATGMAVLTRLGIAREITGRKRNRVYAYRQYLAYLGEDLRGGAGGR